MEPSKVLKGYYVSISCENNFLCKYQMFTFAIVRHAEPLKVQPLVLVVGGGNRQCWLTGLW